MSNKIIGVLMMLVLIIFGYLYTFNYIKAKNIIRIIMVLILLAGVVLLIKF
ncbi:hypothetical protein LH398_12220 [Fusobacterium nucleatum]|uniref:Uncharacterized protein n=1 Tax=Fusobacterium animalis D11 TaxID=556264 RepID=A0A0K9CN91_9FUSO|nr:hypothetical protein [Fusobacterium nucleatum]KMV76005.1 hypothetical protein PSAG_04620 [Fusobacterium animalis D11]